MLISKPWNHYDLKIMLFSKAAQEWWTETLADNRNVGTKRKGTGKPAVRYFVKQSELAHVSVCERFEGVDGDRLAREKLTGKDVDSDSASLVHGNKNPIDATDGMYLPFGCVSMEYLLIVILKMPGLIPIANYLSR